MQGIDPIDAAESRQAGSAQDAAPCGPPERADPSRSCADSHAREIPESGQVVLDLGSGMWPRSLDARAEAGPDGSAGRPLEELRRGGPEALPLADASVDVVVGNCVLNLLPDKDRAFREVYRVLKPGGRLAVADLAWARKPSPALRADLGAIVGGIGEALVLDDYVAQLARAGFRRIRVERLPDAGVDDPGAPTPLGFEDLLSVGLTAFK